MLGRLTSSIRRLLVRFPWVGTAFVCAVYAAGVLWRAFYVFRLHDPRKYLSWDMGLHVRLARRLASPDYNLSINDVTHPPGATVVFSWLYARDDSMLLMTWFQFIVCALIPLSVAFLGWSAFGKKNGQIALVLSSVYFPYIDYGGFFLPEAQLILFVPTAIALVLIALRQKRSYVGASVGLLAGVVFSWLIALSPLAILAGATYAFFLVTFWRGALLKRKAIVLLAVSLGAIPIGSWMTHRCTHANDGQFCVTDNKTGADVLLGHYGRIQTITWKDPRGATHTFGNPSDVQHGYSEKVVVQFGLTDREKNLATAFERMSARPAEAVVLSLQHVYDLFSTAASPSVATREWKIMAIYQDLYLLFLFFPACMLAVDIVRRRGIRALLRSNESLVMSPFLGLVVAVMITTGEPRYRIPYDCLFMLVAIEFWRRWGEGRGPQAKAIVSGVSASSP